MHRLKKAAAPWLVLVPALACADSPSSPDGAGDANLAPTATIVSPPDSSEFVGGHTVRFDGIAEDPEDGPLTGPSLDWTSSIDGRFGIGPSTTTSDLSAGEHRITLTAVDSDGARTTDEIIVTVSENQKPTAVITAPPTGSEYLEGDLVQFEGTASDPEDGPLKGGALVWESQIDGFLGTGEAIETTALSIGQHRIFLTATDSDGASFTHDIIVRVEGPP